MVCTGNNTVASPAFCNINAESGCVYNHAIRQLFYYPVENKTNTENICNYDNHYSYGYGNGYTSTVTEKLTPIYCCDSTRKDLLLKYTDPTGEWVHLVVGAIIGGVLNLATNAVAGNVNNGWQALGYFGIGAAAGALGAGVGAGAGSVYMGGGFMEGFLGKCVVDGVGFGIGATMGANAGFVSGFITGSGNSWMQGNSFGQGLLDGTKAGVIGGVSGAAIGGLVYGIRADYNDHTFWKGDPMYFDKDIDGVQVRFYDQKYASEWRMARAARRFSIEYGGYPEVSEYGIVDFKEQKHYTAIRYPEGNTIDNSLNPIYGKEAPFSLDSERRYVINRQRHYDFLNNPNAKGDPIKDARLAEHLKVKVTHINRYSRTIFYPDGRELHYNTGPLWRWLLRR